jgi:hypothetical protein
MEYLIGFIYLPTDEYDIPKLMDFLLDVMMARS